MAITDADPKTCHRCGMEKRCRGCGGALNPNREWSFWECSNDCEYAYADACEDKGCFEESN